MSDDKELQELFDRTAAEAPKDRLDFMARRAAQLKRPSSKARVPLAAFWLAAGAASLVAGGFFFFGRDKKKPEPEPSKVVFLDPEAIAKPPENPPADGEVAMIVDEDADDPVEGMQALSPETASSAQVSAFEEMLAEPDRAD